MIPKISYAITVHNEDAIYLRTLIGQLMKFKRPEDEIVILDDFSDNSETINELNQVRMNMVVHQHKFSGDFAEHKNYLNSLCTGTYIFQLDADESVHQDFIRVLPEVLMMNPTVDLFRLSRINIVTGITQDDISRWGWKIDEKNRINFPDKQGRIYKNTPDIKWEGKVHEYIVGTSKHADLPEDDEYCIFHIKSIERQRLQNKFYETI